MVVEGGEADAALDDERVLARGDDMAETHAADGIGHEPGVHADLDPDAVQRELAAEGPIAGRHQLRRLSGNARDGEIVARRQGAA